MYWERCSSVSVDLRMLLLLLLLQEECYFAGRIVCEVEGGQLNDTAVMLEGDSTLSEGARVALDLSQLTAYRVFPGQVGVAPAGTVCCWPGRHTRLLQGVAAVQCAKAPHHLRCLPAVITTT